MVVGDLPGWLMCEGLLGLARSGGGLQGLAGEPSRPHSNEASISHWQHFHKRNQCEYALLQVGHLRMHIVIACIQRHTDGEKANECAASVGLQGLTNTTLSFGLRRDGIQLIAL